MRGPSHTWTTAEDAALLRGKADGLTYRQIQAQHLPGRSYRALTERLCVLEGSRKLYRQLPHSKRRATFAGEVTDVDSELMHKDAKLGSEALLERIRVVYGLTGPKVTA